MVCNPYALFRAFQARPDFPFYRHIWTVRDNDEMVRLSQEYQNDDNVDFVMFKSRGYAIFTARAKYLINNMAFPTDFVKRQGQIFLNTWHSVTVKSLGYDIPDGNRLNKNMLRNLLMADYLVSPNEFTTKIYDEAFRLREIYQGKYIEQGSPRNDLVAHTKKEEILQKLARTGIQVDGGKEIILYAPTWFGADLAKPVMDMKKYEALYEYLTKRLDMEKYELLVKPHQAVYRNLSQEEKGSNRYISYTIDTNELLAAVDILITDYSSIYFDFLIRDKPILFYMPDYEEYQKARGIYFKLEELPGPTTFTLSEVAGFIDNIEGIEKKYGERRRETRGWACKYDDGAASPRILDLLIDGKTAACRLTNAKKTGKKTLLFYMGNLESNQVTRLALDLLHGLDNEKYDITLFSLSLEGEEANRNFDQLPKEVRVLRKPGKSFFTQEEQAVYDHTLAKGLHSDGRELEAQRYLMRKEYVQCFGSTEWDYYIDFEGSDPLFSCMVMLGSQNPHAKYWIWQHSHIVRALGNDERARLKAIYDRCDKVIAVSEDGDDPLNMQEYNEKVLRRLEQLLENGAGF